MQSCTVVTVLPFNYWPITVLMCLRTLFNSWFVFATVSSAFKCNVRLVQENESPFVGVMHSFFGKLCTDDAGSFPSPCKTSGQSGVILGRLYVHAGVPVSVPTTCSGDPLPNFLQNDSGCVISDASPEPLRSAPLASFLFLVRTRTNPRCAITTTWLIVHQPEPWKNYHSWTQGNLVSKIC